ncbi:MAG: FeoB-associated Cys-rich membrane protein [Oscillospiraceae bacterium]|nr:FeoB-associated Cys-rich membrane protein [Oscillospiraceae bacterium]
MNIWDIVIILLVALAVGAAVRKMILNKRSGKSNCGCGCAECSKNCSFRKDQ